MNKGKRGPGRPAKLFVVVDKETLRLADGKIDQFYKSKVKKFTTGAYIPISSDYDDREVFVIVLQDGVKIK